MLIATKLQRPRVVRDYLERPRLASILEEGRNRKLTLVAAPAGYGKSSLVASWLARTGYAHVWLSFDRSDGDLTHFLDYLAAGLRQIAPDSCPRLNGIRQSTTLPPIPYITAGLVNDLDEIEGPFSLVFDDYQFVDGSPIRDLTEALLQYLPHHSHLLIITRQDPPLPLVAMRARQESVEIRTQHLRFSEAEAAAFLRARLGALSASSVTEMLAERTEGWPAGLRLATLALHGVEDAAQTASRFGALREGPVTDYLIAEVLAQAAPAMQDFMLKTAICNRLCVDLCAALLDESGADVQAAKQVDAVRRTNLFMVELDDGRRWWRYHHLFQELLQHQLHVQYSREEIRQLHRRAGRWYAEHDFLEEAFEHALAADDMGSAVGLIEEQRYAMLNEDRWHTLERWLARLPKEAKHSRPGLLLAQVWVAYFHHALQTIPALLSHIGETQAAPIDSGLCAAEVRFFQALECFWAGDAAATLTLLDDVLARLPAVADQPRSEAMLYHALAQQMLGLRERARQSLYRHLYSAETPSPMRKTRLLGGLAFLHLLDGELDAMLEVTDQVMDVALSANNAYIEAWMHYLRAYGFFARNELDDAQRSFEQAVAQRYVIHTRAAVDSMAGLAMTYLARGDTTQAHATLDLLQTFAAETGELTYVTIAHTVRARMMLQQDRADAAARRLQNTPLEPDSGILFLWLEIPRMTACRVQIGRGDRSDIRRCLPTLDALRVVAAANHNVRQLIDIDILRALAHRQLQQEAEAEAALAQVLDMAAPGGWIRPFIEAGEKMAAWLLELDARHAQHRFVSRLLAAFSGEAAPTSRPTVDVTIEPLTTREVEVLELLAQRMSNQEIAAELIVSIATVKRHTANIYQKLHVNNRRQAVAKAQSTGQIGLHT